MNDNDDLWEGISKMNPMLSEKDLKDLRTLAEQMYNVVPDAGYAQPKKKTPKQLRKEHPALNDAWEQYQVVLKLVRQQEEE